MVHACCDLRIRRSGVRITLGALPFRKGFSVRSHTSVLGAVTDDTR